MKSKTYVYGITFFTSYEMHQSLKKISDERNISLSELLRDLVEQYLDNNTNKASGENR